MFTRVMAGLGPATRVLLWGTPEEDVGARAKPGHDTMAAGRGARERFGRSVFGVI